MPFEVGIHHEPNASHGIGSDSQRPFAIVIVGGLVGALAINVFLLPTLYVFVPTTIALTASVPQGSIAGFAVSLLSNSQRREHQLTMQLSAVVFLN